jgi:hypothetical protein
MTTLDLLPEVPQDTYSGDDIPTLVGVLRDNFAVRADHNIPTRNIRMSADGNFEIAGVDFLDIPAKITEDGVAGGFRYDPSGLYKPTSLVDQHIATLTEIPVRYVRKMREQDVELLSINVNRWTARFDADHRRLLRTIVGRVPGSDNVTGVLRAILSDRFGLGMDYLDVVMSLLEGMNEAGYTPENIRALNLTPNRLYIDLEVPEIAVPARSLMEGYVSPFTGQTAAELPMVHAGIRITDSEIGQGKLRTQGYAIFEVCSNGALMTEDRFERVHLGGVLSEGTVNWSSDTRKSADELIRKQMRDAVKFFMNEEYLNSVVDRLEKDAGVEVTKPETVIETVAKEQAYTVEEQDNILSKFMMSKQFTSGGVYNAITAAAQDIKDFDRRHEFEASAPQAMRVAAKAAATA